MFGSTGWGQNAQQNQNQGTSTGGFGQPAQPSAFGSTGFGGPSAFGATQPQQNTFGATPNAGTTGFGGFGQQPRPGMGATGGTFGQPAASTSTTAGTGFGGFGGSTGATAFGSTSNTTGGGLFGAPAATTGGFGSSATTGFGATGFGATATTTSAGTINGTATPAYQVTSEREGTSLGMTNYQAITCMQAYKNYSFEELRVQDYAAGRKNATSTGFAGAGAFGATAAPTTTTGAFGQPAAATTTFGQPAAGTTGGFGATTATNAFGQPAQQPQQQPPPATGFGGFGQTATATTGTGLFGQTNTQQQQQQPATAGFGATTGGFGTSTGLFGQQQQQPQQQQQQQPATGGLFGAGNTTGGFGSTAPKPAFGGFGTTTTTQPAATGFSGFGQTGATTTGTTGGLFGQTTQQQQPQQPAATGFGGFGTTNPTAGTTGGLFGNPQTATQPATTGLFGQNAQQQQQQQPAAGGFGATGFGGGLFGQQQQQQPQQPQQQATTGGLFGQPAAQTTQPATGGLFGNAFGQNNQQQQPAQQQQATGLFGGGGLFAPKPTAPTTGLFGNPQNQTTTAGTGLFGQPAQPAQTGGLFNNLGASVAGQQQQPAQQATGGLFGPKPAGSGLFGTTAPGTTGTGLFGSTTAAPATAIGTGLFGSQGPVANGGLLGQSQQPLIASLDGNIYNTNPLLSASAKADASHIITLGERDKRPAIAYTKKPLPRVTTPKLGPLRGFSTPPPGGLNSPTGLDLSIGLGGSAFGRPQSAQGSRIGVALGGLSDSTSSSPGKGLAPDAFKPRSSVKKLILPNKVDPLSWNETLDTAVHTLQNEFGISSPTMGTAPLGTPGGRTKVTWDPQLGRAARENALSNSASRPGVGSPKLFGGQSLTSSQFGSGRRFTGPSPSVSTGRLPPESVEVTPSKTPVSALKNKGHYAPSKEPGEYWTEPPMHELRDMSVEQLKNLEGFKVHRNGFGHIEFLDPVDLTTVKNVEDIPGNYVLFDAKECTVYPEESEKPDQGEGMNVRARISLVQCWPVEKATQQPITDAKNPKIQAHVKKLRGIQDTVFKDYDAATGTWVFEVPHFTRYGLDEDEDDEYEEEEVEMEMQEETTTPFGTPSKHIPAPEPSPGVRSESARSEEMAVDDEEVEPEQELSDAPHSEDDIEYATEEEPSAPAPVPRPWASTLGLDPQRVNVMQASFFHTAPEETAQPVSRLRTFDNSMWKGSSLGGAGQQPRQSGSMGVSQGLQAPPKPAAPAPAPPIVTPLRDLKLGAYKNSVAFGAESSFVDAGLSLARSFRVGWGPNGLLAHCGKLCGLSETKAHASSTVTVERMTVLSGDADVEASRASKLFEIQLQITDIETDEDGVPVAVAKPDVRFGDYCKMFESEDRSMEASLWRLGAALFDPIDIQLKDDVSYDIRKTVEGLRYKTSLSDWLEKTVEPSVKRDLALQDHASGARRAFTMLTGHQVEQATETALNTGDLNLAMLISQAGGNDVFKSFLVTQLEQWKEGEMDSFMDPAYGNVVALLAGLHQTSVRSTGSRAAPDHDLFASLDWKRVFGLHLWYGTSLEDSHEAALQQALTTAPGLKPRPWYEEEPPKSQKLWKVASKSGTEDGLFKLIRLPMEPALQLDVVLSPRGFSPSPLDYRLPWHLYILLAVVLRKRDFGDRAEIGRGNMEDQDEMDNAPLGTSVLAQSVTLSYASQLESIGEKEKALFVLLHLEQAEGRTIAIKQLLTRHAGEWNADLLTGKLCIPATWIAEANGIRAQYEQNVFQAYQFFLDGGQQQLAHNIALNDLAPEVVIRGDPEVLKTLFLNFTPNEISGWYNTGNLYLQYAKCVTMIPKLLAVFTKDGNAEPDAVQRAELERLAQAVPQLLENLPKMFEYRNDLRQRVCLAEMLSQLLRLVPPLRMYGIAIRSNFSSSMLPEQARLQHVQSSSRERLFRALEVATSA